jgi:hypothetical protein
MKSKKDKIIKSILHNVNQEKELNTNKIPKRVEMKVSQSEDSSKNKIFKLNGPDTNSTQNDKVKNINLKIPNKISNQDKNLKTNLFKKHNKLIFMIASITAIILCVFLVLFVKTRMNQNRGKNFYLT